MESAANANVIVALSGGVDSAVAALCLIREGYDVQGLHMTNWEDDDGYCTAARDFQDARTIATELGIPLHQVNFSRQYREQVFADFLAEHRAGRTPNPDVLCNREIKFGVLPEYARRLGGDFIATGHYAQVERGPVTKLIKGEDSGKDQSYFLHAVTGEALAKTFFPLGTMWKSDVRRMANEAGLPVHDKKDSTGICFIGERPFREFLSRFLPGQPGTIETPERESVGEHAGLMYYTLGQRQGLGIGGRAGGGDEPWFVAAKDEERNVLTVVQGRDHPLLWSVGLIAADLRWISGAPETLDSNGAMRCTVKTRYRQAGIDCTVRKLANGAVEVGFDDPQWAVTPGQYAVFYLDRQCLGGGVIERRISEA